MPTLIGGTGPNEPTTNLSSGVTNTSDRTVLGSYIAMDPTRVHEYWNDFNLFLATDWVVTETQAGATQAIVAGNGGILALVNSAADDDINAIRLANLTFRFSKDKRFWIKGRVSLSDVIESELLFGVVDTAVAFGPTDGIYFSKADGVATVGLVLEKDGSLTTSSQSQALVAATYVELGITYTPGDGVIAWINGSPFAKVTNLTNFPDDADVAPVIGVRNGDSAAVTMNADYIFVAQER